MKNDNYDMEFISGIKNLIISLFSITLAYFAPIKDMVFVIFFIFMVNCISGMLAGIVAKHERFNIRKFLHCLLETCAYYMVVLTIYIIGEKMQNLNSALQCITGITYTICYFYGTNILRNSRKLFPNSKVLNFIYYVLSFEIVRRIPYLQNFLDHDLKDSNYEKD